MVPATTTRQPATCSPARPCWLRAWDRAKAEKLIPFKNADGSWAVKSYTVSVVGAGWSDLTCNCAAGRNHRICKHAAVTAKAIAAHVTPIRGTEKGKEAATTAASFTQPVGTFVALHIPSPLDALYA